VSAAAAARDTEDRQPICASSVAADTREKTGADTADTGGNTLEFAPVLHASEPACGIAAGSGCMQLFAAAHTKKNSGHASGQ